MENFNEADIQNHFLAKAKKQRTPMIIYTMNGFQVKCKIIGYDRFAILVDSDGVEKMLYKHAVSTIQPDEQKTDTREKEYGYSGYRGRR